MGSLYSSIGQIDQAFRKQYPGFRTSSVAGYNSMGEYTTAMNEQYMRNIESVLSQADFAIKDFESTGSTLKTLQERSASSNAQKQVLQAGNEIAVMTTAELGKINVALNTQSAMIADAQGLEIQKEESRKADMQKFFTSGNFKSNAKFSIDPNK